MNLINAFITGAQFAQRAGLLAQDAKAKKDEEIHWRTIGEGEEAHAVPIDGPEPNTKKAESKKVEPKDKKATRQYKSETSQKRPEEIAQRMQRERNEISPMRELLGRSPADDPLLLIREGGAAALARSPTAVLDELRDSVQAQMDRLDDQTRIIDSAKAQKDLSESLNSLSRAAGKKVFKTRQITKERQASGVASLMYDMLDEARDKAQEQGDSRKLAKLALLANMYTSAATIGLNNIEAYVKIRQKAEQRLGDETDKYAKQHNEAIANAKRVIDEQWNSLKSAKQELKNALKSIGLN